MPPKINLDASARRMSEKLQAAATSAGLQSATAREGIALLKAGVRASKYPSRMSTARPHPVLLTLSDDATELRWSREGALGALVDGALGKEQAERCVRIGHIMDLRPGDGLSMLLTLPPPPAEQSGGRRRSSVPRETLRLEFSDEEAWGFSIAALRALRAIESDRRDFLAGGDGKGSFRRGSCDGGATAGGGTAAGGSGAAGGGAITGGVGAGGGGHDTAPPTLIGLMLFDPDGDPIPELTDRLSALGLPPLGESCASMISITSSNDSRRASLEAPSRPSPISPPEDDGVAACISRASARASLASPARVVLSPVAGGGGARVCASVVGGPSDDTMEEEAWCKQQ